MSESEDSHNPYHYSTEETGYHSTNESIVMSSVSGPTTGYTSMKSSSGVSSCSSTSDSDSSASDQGSPNGITKKRRSKHNDDGDGYSDEQEEEEESQKVDNWADIWSLYMSQLGESSTDTLHKLMSFYNCMPYNNAYSRKIPMNHDLWPIPLTNGIIPGPPRPLPYLETDINDFEDLESDYIPDPDLFNPFMNNFNDPDDPSAQDSVKDYETPLKREIDHVIENTLVSHHLYKKSRFNAETFEYPEIDTKEISEKTFQMAMRIVDTLPKFCNNDIEVKDRRTIKDRKKRPLPLDISSVINAGILSDVSDCVLENALKRANRLFHGSPETKDLPKDVGSRKVPANSTSIGGLNNDGRIILRDKVISRQRIIRMNRESMTSIKSSNYV